MKLLAFIDLDGTLLNSEARFERAREAGNGEIDWATALTPALLKLDIPFEGAAETLDELELAGWQIIFLTSRPDYKGLRTATLSWLKKHSFLNKERPLLMKPLKLRLTKTPAWKAQIVASYAASALPSNEEIKIIFVDDDPLNLAAVRSLQLTNVWSYDTWINSLSTLIHL